MNSRSLIPFLILSCILILPASSQSKPDDILSILPDDSLAWVRVSEIGPLSEDIDSTAREVLPANQDPPPPSVLLLPLGQVLPQSAVWGLDSFEKSGFDPNGDVIVVWKETVFQPPAVALCVGDKERVRETLETGRTFTDGEYNGIPFRTAENRTYAFLGDWVVLESSHGSLRDWIDTYKESRPSFRKGPGHERLTEALESQTNDITVYAALDRIAKAVTPILESIADGQKNPMMGIALEPLQQMEYACAALNLDERGLSLDTFLRPSDESPFQAVIETEPKPLKLIRYIPANTGIAGGMHLDSKAFSKTVIGMFLGQAQSRDEAAAPSAEEADKLLGPAGDFAKFSDKEVAFGAFVNESMPNAVFLYTVTDQDTAKQYMENLAAQIQGTIALMKLMGLGDAAQFLSNVQVGEPQTYQDIPINVVHFTKNSQGPLGSMSLWYAFHSDKLVLSVEPDSNVIKKTIDVLLGKAEGIDTMAGFSAVDSALPPQSNLRVYYSPFAQAKPIVESVIDHVTVESFEEIESNIVMGGATAHRNGGIASRLYVSLEETNKTLAMNERINKIIEESNPQNRMERYASQGELDGMLEYVEKTTKEYPNMAWDLQKRLAGEYEEHGKIEDLIAHFEAKTEQPETAPNAYLVLGLAYQRTGERNKAREMYEKAMELRSEDERVEKSVDQIEKIQAVVDFDRSTIASRDPNAEPNMIDLTDYYNCRLDGMWNEKQHWPPEIRDIPNDLREVPTGIREFAGVRFDVRGMIQLLGQVIKSDGIPYPERVNGIKINRRFDRLHILHATQWSASEGETIGRYVLHYADGSIERFNIVYGETLADWWVDPNRLPELENGVPAWSGSNPFLETQAVRQSFGVRTVNLFKSTWKNPKPNVEVESIDFVSEVTNAAPFLVAVTVE